jgi:hypothetical protein
MTPAELSTLSPEQKRVKIAEACGWKWVPEFNSRKKENYLIPPTGRHCVVWKDGLLGGNQPPDYLNDLNAMHSTEKVLTERQRLQYIEEVGKIIRDELANSGLNPRAMEDREVIYHHMHATAAQRADAFLLSL